MIEWREILGGIAFVGAIIGTVPYIVSILKKKTRPHMFTWLVWAILTIMICVIQITEGAGPAVWHMLITALTTTIIAILSFFLGEKQGSRLDWLAFISSLAAIPLWIVTKDPTASAVLLTVIDVVAFWPTVSKTWKHPHGENLFYYCVWLLRYPLATAAIANWNLANAVYPATWSVIGVFFVGMILYRRAVEKN
jgi:hypothetical protein